MEEKKGRVRRFFRKKAEKHDKKDRSMTKKKAP